MRGDPGGRRGLPAADRLPGGARRRRSAGGLGRDASTGPRSTSSSCARPGTTPSAATSSWPGPRSLPRVLNPLDVLEWNTDKERYLTDLAAAGVPVVPTAVRRARRRRSSRAWRAVRRQAGGLGRRAQLGSLRSRARTRRPRALVAPHPRRGPDGDGAAVLRTTRGRRLSSTWRATYSHALARHVPLPRRASARSSTSTSTSARPRRRRPSGRSPTAAIACAPGGASLRTGRPRSTSAVLELEISEPVALPRARRGRGRAARGGDRGAASAGARVVLISGADTASVTLGGVSVVDTLGRPLRDLRISVTDRCNFRCVYCMPKEVFGARLPVPRALASSSPSRRSRASRERSRDLGVEKIRLTGGEPLVRRDLERLIAHARRDRRPRPHADHERFAPRRRRRRRLREAGLKRITVSLDSLDDDVFAP